MNYVISFLIFVFFVCGSTAQDLTDYHGISQLSMGGVLSTMGGVDAMYGGQAGLAEIESWVADVSVVRRYSINGFHRIAAGFALPVANGAFGISIRQQGVASLQQSIAGLSYARRIGTRVRAALQVDYVSLGIDGFGNTSSLTSEMSIQVQALDQLTLASHFFSPGSIALAGDDPISSVVEIGGLYEPSQQLDIHFAVRKVIDRSPEILFGIQYDIHERLSLRVGGNTGTGEVSAGARVAASESLLVHIGAAYHTSLGMSPGVGVQWR